MTWIKLDDSLPNNPKILPLSDGAFRLYIEGLCYANQYLTDGYLANAVLIRLDQGGNRDELVWAKLWVESKDGIQINDYTEHQSSRADVEAKKEMSRQRLTKHRAAKASGVDFTEAQVLERWGTNCHICEEPINLDAPRHSKSAGWKNGLHLDHVIPLTKGGEHTLENVKPAHAMCNLRKSNHVGNAFHSSPETETETDTENRIQKQSDFERFWSVYPRKAGKQDAQRSFERALKAATLDEILAGAQRYADDPNRVAQFTAHPSTWLNQGRWSDEPLPPRTAEIAHRGLITTPTVVPPRFTADEAPDGVPMPDSVRDLFRRMSDLP